MSKQSKAIRTIEDAVDSLKEQVFTRLENGENSLADIETIARVINSISLTQEHLALTKQSEQYTSTATVTLGPGTVADLGGYPSNEPPAVLPSGKVFNL
jgi:hypothetical protein